MATVKAPPARQRSPDSGHVDATADGADSANRQDPGIAEVAVQTLGNGLGREALNAAAADGQLALAGAPVASAAAQPAPAAASPAPPVAPPAVVPVQAPPPAAARAVPPAAVPAPPVPVAPPSPTAAQPAPAAAPAAGPAAATAAPPQQATEAPHPAAASEPVAEAAAARPARAPIDPQSLLPEVQREYYGAVRELERTQKLQSLLERQRALVEDRIAAQQARGVKPDPQDARRVAVYKEAEATVATKVRTIGTTVTTAAADMKALHEAPSGTTPISAVNVILARRRPDYVSERTTQELHQAPAAPSRGIGLAASDTRETSYVKKGVVITDRRTRERSATLEGYRDEEKRVITAQKGDVKKVTTRSGSVSFTWVNGVPMVTFVSNRSSERTDARRPTAVNKDSSGTTVTVGAGGASVLRDASQQKDDQGSKTSSQYSLVRREGVLGLSRSFGGPAGSSPAAKADPAAGKPAEGVQEASAKDVKVKVDPVTGKPVEGVQQAGKVEGGIQLSPDAVGAQLGGSLEKKFQLSKNVSFTLSAGADVKYSVAVREIPSSPVKYVVALTLALITRSGGTLGGEHETAAKSTASGTATLQRTTTRNATYTYTMSDVETVAYLRDINAAAGGQAQGTNKELALLAQAKNAGAAAALKTLMAYVNEKDPASADNLAPGQGFEISTETEEKAGLAPGGRTASGFGVSAEASKSSTNTIKRSRSLDQDGNMNVTLEVSAGDAAKLGLTLAYQVALGGSREAKDTLSRSITFKLKPGTGDYHRQLGAIMGAETIEQLVALVEREEYRNLLVSMVQTRSHDVTKAGTIGVGPAQVAPSLGATKGHTISADKDGKITYTVTAAASAALDPSVATQKANIGDRDNFSTTVTPEGTATGELSTTKITPDRQKSQRSATRGKALAAVFGSAKAVESKQDITGTRIANADYDAIIGRAQDERGWLTAVPERQNRVRIRWIAVGMKIRQVHGDKLAVATLLRDFVAEAPEGAAVVQNVIRPEGTTGGDMYEWPEEIANVKPLYDAVVLADPVTAAGAKVTAGKTAEAISDLTGAKQALEKVYAVIGSDSAHFEHSAVRAEMITTLRTRYAEVQAELRILQATADPVTAEKAHKAQRSTKAPPAPKPGEPQLAPDQQEARALPKNDRARIRGEAAAYQLEQLFVDNKKREAELVEEINAQFAGRILGAVGIQPDADELRSRVVTLAVLHNQWQTQVRNYQAICWLFGWPEKIAAKPDPARLAAIQARLRR